MLCHGGKVLSSSHSQLFLLFVQKLVLDFSQMWFFSVYNHM